MENIKIKEREGEEQYIINKKKWNCINKNTLITENSLKSSTTMEEESLSLMWKIQDPLGFTQWVPFIGLQDLAVT